MCVYACHVDVDVDVDDPSGKIKMEIPTARSHSSGPKRFTPVGHTLNNPDRNLADYY